VLVSAGGHPDAFLLGFAPKSIASKATMLSSTP
jgi:hypothetical protein